VQQFPQRLAGRQNLVLLANLQDEQTVLSDREGLVPPRSAAPSADARQAMCEVLVRPAIETRIEEIEPAARTEKYEGARRPCTHVWVMLHDGDLRGLRP
jgi:hypothetical protein